LLWVMICGFWSSRTTGGHGRGAHGCHVDSHLANLGLGFRVYCFGERVPGEWFMVYTSDFMV